MSKFLPKDGKISTKTRHLPHLIKRYWVLANDNYYPLSGLRNVKTSYSILEIAEIDMELKIENKEYDNIAIYDSETQRIVMEYHRIWDDYWLM